MHTICGLFGYTRQAHYKSLQYHAKRVVEEDIILKMVKDYRIPMPRVGGYKLHDMINKAGYRIGRADLFSILRNNNMLVKRKARFAITTNSNHWMMKYQNLIRGFSFTKPNQLWVSDITYIQEGGKFAYLSLITDVYAHLIVGYCLYRTLEAIGTINALRMAIESVPKAEREGLIHHSDRGIQYCCHEYVNLLKNNEIRIIMTENGDPYENAVAERVNGILKDEWLNHEVFHSFEQAKSRIDEVIYIYNNVRPHASCDMLTPIQAYAMSGELKKRWKKKEYPKKNNSFAPVR